MSAQELIAQLHATEDADTAAHFTELTQER